MDNMADRNTVEAQRDSLAAQILVLSRRYNQLSPPSRLPPELLAEIFANIYPYHPRQLTSQGPFIAAQVCHYWREIALKNPRLWTHIELDRSARYIEVMIERSGECLLDVSEVHIRDRASNYRLVWPQLDRIRSLTFNDPPDGDELPRKKKHAPFLEVFSEPWKTMTEGVLLPFLDTPRLRHAKVTAPSVPHLRLLPSLTRLELRWCIDQYDTPPMSDIMTALGSLPLLSHLCADFSFKDDEQVLEHCSVASLKSLKTLVVGDSSNLLGAAFLLKHVELPPTTQVTVNLATKHPYVTVRAPQMSRLLYENTATILRRWFARTTATTLQLRAKGEFRQGEYEVKLAASEKRPPEIWWTSSEQQAMTLSLNFPYFPDMHPLLPPLIPELRLLIIGAHWDPSHSEALSATVGQLHTVEGLTIYNERRMRDRKSHLQILDLDKFLSGPNAAGFPKLSTLKLIDFQLGGGATCCYCAEFDWDGIPTYKDCECELHYPRLLAWLSKRRDAATPLGRVVLERCAGMTDERKLELQQLVTEEVVEIDRPPRRRGLFG